jgi:hypothetical protein
MNDREQLRNLVWHYVPTSEPPEHKTDATQVAWARDLPLTLMMGVRDDGSFQKAGHDFSIDYRDDAEVVATLSYQSGRLTLAERWNGVERVPVSASTSELPQLVRHYRLDPRWDDWFEDTLTALGNFHYVRFGDQPTTMVGFPDGLSVDIILPVSAGRLPELNNLYVGLDGSLDRPLQAIATSHLGIAPVNYIQQVKPSAERTVQLEMKILSESLNRLRLPQRPWPRLEGAGDDWAMTDYRVAYVHHCQTVLRDLVPICTQIVQHGFVAPFRRETVGPGRDDLFWGSAAYRACVCPSASSLGVIQFDSLVPGLRVTYDRPGEKFLQLAGPSLATIGNVPRDQLRRDAEQAAANAVAAAERFESLMRAEWDKVQGQ